jgi:hypothetical protein
MEDFTLPSVGARFKNGGVVHPFFQNARPILKLLHDAKNIKYKKKLKN